LIGLLSKARDDTDLEATAWVELWLWDWYWNWDLLIIEKSELILRLEHLILKL
jgi:hypothetical protein